ncbi:AmmeMemoRadiSam system radical SAM enzyme [bacterium]|nr:AmmeMemoRadiSam system radical SAM enzyme [bacterium]
MPCSLKDLLKDDVTRKEFLEALGHQSLLAIGYIALFSTADAAGWILKDNPDVSGKIVEAKYYRKLDAGAVQCLLCPHECIVSQKERGECGVRENRNGFYYALTHSKPCALHVDPVEKKPLFHVLPGSDVFSLATVGCNMRCLFCQNWQISQARPEDGKYMEVSPGEIIRMTKEKGCRMIAYTYSEPTIFFEYMLDTAKMAHKAGLMNISHSNGYINREPLSELLDSIDAANIDLKGFTEGYYKDICGGDLKPVLQSLKQIKKSATHLEITNLIVPTKNDQPENIKKMSKWIRDELGPEVPLHFSRFYPRYKLQNLPPTPVKTLEMARDIAMEEGLHFVYIGNLRSGHEAENTYCSNCRKLIIERRGYAVIRVELKGGRCRYCEHAVAGIWG